MLAESVSANRRVSQVVQQLVPNQWASHGESPSPGKCTPPLVRYVQQSSIRDDTIRSMWHYNALQLVLV